MPAIPGGTWLWLADRVAPVLLRNRWVCEPCYISLFLFKFFVIFIYLAVFDLFLFYFLNFGCAESSLLLRLLIAVASLVAEQELQGSRASVVAVRGLRSCSSRTLEHRLSSYGP